MEQVTPYNIFQKGTGIEQTRRMKTHQSVLVQSRRASRGFSCQLARFSYLLGTLNSIQQTRNMYAKMVLVESGR